MKRFAASLIVGILFIAGGAGATPNTAVTRPGFHDPTAAEPIISPYIYLNRCVGGCQVHESGVDDARAQDSSIPCSGNAQCSGGSCMCSQHTAKTWTIHEFTDSAGQTGAPADADWAAILHCVQEVYSPFNIIVTDQLPAGGLSYNEGIVAGNPADIGFGTAGILGIAPGGCDPQDNAVSFSFANSYVGSARVAEICATAAQETAHAYGLEHVYEYPDHSSACNDPMTYRPSCGQQFFRNAAATCGEYAPRACFCGGTQNDHVKIKALFGPGTPITAPPHIAILTPAAGATIVNGTTVQASGSSQRGIAKVQLWLNGFNWVEKTYTPQGTQPDSAYPLSMPASVPDGVIDIVVKAYDDIGVETDSAKVTVTKGAPCATAASCAAGQKCDAGKCYWDPPTGQLGDACTYSQFCVSDICQGTADKQICTESCITGVTGACPTGYDCIDTGGNSGICFPTPASAGCCSAAGHDSAWLHGGLSLAVLGLVLRRRRRSV
jgi:MYXO-CTERM domain-containing protein